MQPDYGPHQVSSAGRVPDSNARVMQHPVQKPSADPAPDCAMCADAAMTMKQQQGSQLGLS